MDDFGAEEAAEVPCSEEQAGDHNQEDEEDGDKGPEVELRAGAAVSRVALVQRERR